MNWLIKKKCIPAYTHPEANDKSKTRYVNYEVEKINALYRQVIERKFKQSEMGKEYKFARIFEGEEQKKQYAKDRFKAKLAEKVMVQIEEEIKRNRKAKAEKVWEVVPEFDIMNEMGSSPRYKDELPTNKENDDDDEDAVSVFDAGVPECKETNDEELLAEVEEDD